MTEHLETIYPVAFFSAVVVFAVAEIFLPRRPQTTPINQRWVTNIGLFVIGLALHRLCLPVSVILAAKTAENFQFGLFNLAGLVGWKSALIGIFALDLWKYGEHRLMHATPILWRLHVTHHSDVDSDFTTTERHHPLEIIFAWISAITAVFLLGITPLAMVAYLLLASVVSLFAHSNVRIPEHTETLMSKAIVTPGFHNVHHSAARYETDSNYGMVFTIWDRIFGSYRSTTPSQEAERLIGLEYFRDERSARIDRVLWQPYLMMGESPTRGVSGSKPGQ